MNEGSEYLPMRVEFEKSFGNEIVLYLSQSPNVVRGMSRLPGLGDSLEAAETIYVSVTAIL